MSKRFGRNQRRKMREQLNQLTQDRDRWQWRHEELGRIGARNRQIVEDTAAVLGRHFISLNPESVEVRNLDAIAHGWRVPFITDVPHGPQETPSNECFVSAALEILRGSTVRRDPMGNMHMRFTCGGTEVGYGLSEQAFHQTPRHILARNISAHIAENLLNQIRGEDSQP